MKVDTHAHFMSRPFYEEMASLPGITVIDRQGYGTGAKHLVRGDIHVVTYREAWLDPDHSIRDMDRTGIDMRLISLAPPNVYIFDQGHQAAATRRVNDATIAFCQGRPDRFRALPSLPLGDVEAALEELNRVASAPEVAGVAIGSNVAGTPLSDPIYEPVWARINELRIPVVEHPLHPTFNGDIQDRNLSVILGFWYDTVLMVSRLILNGVFERYPDFPFLVAHTGSGLISTLDRLDWGAERWSTELPKSASHYAKQLYYDTCGTYGPMLMECHEAVGADHMMFGTDYPYIEIDFAHVNDLEITAAEKAAINGDTAAKIFKLE